MNSFYHGWRNEGLLFEIKGQNGWMNSHAQVPTVLVNNNDFIRVYFATRPKQELSLTTFVDLSLLDFSQIYLHPEPILPLGGSGMFDEHGIMPSSVLEKDGKIYLYYSGWSRSSSLPYSNFTGLAISDDGGRSFKKVGPGPIIDRTYWGPYSATSPHVMIVNDIWYMFYCSGVDWVEINGKLEHTYDIKIADSHNGVDWRQLGKVAIKQKDRYEAITRPTVYHDGNRFHMLFCYRGSESFRGGVNSYKIGYASSHDLIKWDRADEEFPMIKSETGWDLNMSAYPCVHKIGGKLFLFYNGSDFGRQGFGAMVKNL